MAGQVFSQLRKRSGDAEQAPPDPKDLNRSTRGALLAASMQGLVFGLVRAAVERVGDRGYQAVTHESQV